MNEGTIVELPNELNEKLNNIPLESFKKDDDHEVTLPIAQSNKKRKWLPFTKKKSKEEQAISHSHNEIVNFIA